MALSVLWKKLTTRQEKLLVRRAPEPRGFKETIRLVDSSAYGSDDFGMLLKAIKLAGGTVGRAKQQVCATYTGMASACSLLLASEQQVGSNLPLTPRYRQVGGSFTLFNSLPAELRAKVWQHAGLQLQPRLAFVLLDMPTQAWMEQAWRGTNDIRNVETTFDRVIKNRIHLIETDLPRSNLLASCREGRREVLRATTADPAFVEWMKRLGLAHFNINSNDLLYLGGFSQGAEGGSRDADRIIPLNLVLGAILPKVLVRADVFLEFFSMARFQSAGQPISVGQPTDILNEAVADLQGLGATYARLFANNPSGLPQPRLPGTIIFMLSNGFREYSPDFSPCTIPGHREQVSRGRESCCLHYEHLEIIPEEDIDGWMDAHLLQSSVNLIAPQSHWYLRHKTVPGIRHIWASWRSHPNAVPHIPRLLFAWIKGQLQGSSLFHLSRCLSYREAHHFP